MSQYTTANVLGLRALDRVQIYNKAIIREYTLGVGYGTTTEPPPFWYFQFIDPKGRLALRSPSGMLDYVPPTEVADIICRPEGPIVIRAMPQAVFVSRLGRPVAERHQPVPDECYADATLLFASKDRWGHAAYYARFNDPAHHYAGDGLTFIAPLAPGERDRLASLTRRNVMPVQAKQGGYLSADQGIAAAATKTRATFNRFLAASLAGQAAAAKRLAAVDLGR